MDSTIKAPIKSARGSIGQVGHVTRRLHLHIGPRKSGTTFLQQALISNARALRAEGLIYPVPDRSLRQRLLGAPRFLNHEKELLAAYNAEASSTTEWLAHALAATSGDIILSGEAVAACSPAELDHLTAYLDVGDLHVIITARSLEAVIPSSWQQHIRNGRTASLGAYVEDIAKRNDQRQQAPLTWATEPTQGFWLANDHAALAERWIARGAQVSVVTVPAGSAPAQTLWQRFLGALGLSNAAIAAFTIPNMQPIHVGLTAPEALTLREIIWQLECGGIDRTERSRWAHRLVEDVFRGRPQRGPALHLTGTELHRARQWAADDSAQLAILVEDGQVALYGDLADLTPGEAAMDINQAQLSRQITDLGGRCIAYLEGART
jgi:hypothetical protein